MQFENLIVEKKEGVAIIRLNRPKAFNAVNLALSNDLIGALYACADDDATRAVIITGEGRGFCAGGDLAAFKDSLDDNPAAPIREVITAFNIAIQGVRSMPKPVIAAINGAAGGAGLSLAAACDLRICAAGAKFIQAYTGVALVPDGGWTLLVPLLIGFGRASELIFLNEPFDAAKALAWGLVHRVVEDGELGAAALEMAQSLAQGPTRAFAIAKENLNRAMQGLLASQLDQERAGICQAASTADYKEGVRAFFEKRPPSFTGK
ncbi:MAG: enoyl-CoA hydratase/isomerase family protein, partial [Deltaproteobacteria bacterium]|nr:enoyl-CoA hydratase/isomerase family protein [Deltaproteobacteria bacterium]